MHARRAACGPASRRCCHGPDEGRPRSALPAKMDKPLRTSGIRAGYQKSPIRRCFKPRPPLSAGCAGFASGCRSHEQGSELTSLGGCPASCPDAHRSTHGHRHVRNWATTGIIQLRRESTIYRARARAHPPRGECARVNFLVFVCRAARRARRPAAQRTSTFLNCQGSRLSMSSGNRPGRSASGVQSV